MNASGCYAGRNNHDHLTTKTRNGTGCGAGIAGNIYSGANIVAASGNVTAAGLVGPLYGTVMTAAQPNITSLGTITTLNAGSISATSIGATNINVNSNLNVTGATIFGLSTLSVAGNITASNLTTAGTTVNSGINTTGNIVIANGSFYFGNASLISGLAQNSTISGMQSTIDLLTANAAYQSSQITAANLAIAGANAAIISANTSMKNYVDAQISSTTSAWTSNAATQQGQITTLQSNATTQQGQITTLQSQVYSNSNTAAYLPVYGGAIHVSGITNSNSTGVGNIGNSTVGFNTIFAKATSAQYADLAERYIADSDYESATVVIFGGEQEITTTNLHGDARVAGAISTNPAYLMNDATTGLPVALRGRIPVKVIGAVRKGDSLVTSTTPGYAVSVGNDLNWGQAVFAKSLETNLEPGEKTIEAVIL